jgi:hypothetical protein
MENEGLKMVMEESGEEDFSDTIPTDEEKEYLRLEKIRKESVHAKYETKKEEVRKHTWDLRKQIALLEDNVKRNNALLDDMHENMWREIYG